VKKAWGQPVDTGQIEQVTEKNILPETADNNATNTFSKNPLGFVCAVGLSEMRLTTNDLKEEELIVEISY